MTTRPDEIAGVRQLHDNGTSFVPAKARAAGAGKAAAADAG